MRSHYRITRKTKGVMIAVVVAAFLGGAGSFVSHLVTEDTPAPVAPVAVVVNGPDYAGYASAVSGLGVNDPIAQGPIFVDQLCGNIRAGRETAGVVRGQLAGNLASYDYSESVLLAVAGDAKAFVCYR